MSVLHAFHQNRVHDYVLKMHHWSSAYNNKCLLDGLANMALKCLNFKRLVSSQVQCHHWPIKMQEIVSRRNKKYSSRVAVLVVTR